MSHSLITNFRRLSFAPRRFLVFTVLNVLSWHSLVGPVLVLFAREIQMPPSYVGFIVSFVPLSMLLAFVTVPLVERFGPKRLMVYTWIGRNFWACLAFSLPWVLWYGHPRYGWLVLMLAVLGFCFVRSIGVGGWFPWLHEIVPDRERSAYFGAESSVEHGMIVVANVLHLIVLSFNPDLYHFLFIYGIGITAGLASLAFMVRVPGGRQTPPHQRMGMSSAAYRVVLADRSFLIFVALATLGFASISFLTTTSVLYMRDALHQSPRFVMMVLTANSTGVFLTVRYWSNFAEHQGTARGVFLAMLGLGLLEAALLLLAPGAPWTLYLLPPTFVFAACLAVAFSVIMHRAMLDYVQPEARVAYTNVWLLGASLALGLSPVAVGFAIDYLDLWGYRLCFAFAALCALTVSGLGARWLRDATPLDRETGRALDPLVPVQAVARILWISLGLHASSRRKPDTHDET